MIRNTCQSIPQVLSQSLRKQKPAGLVAAALSLLWLPLLATSVDAAVSSLEIETVASGLTRPVAIAHAGDSRLFVVTQPGRIIRQTGSNSFSTFLDISSRVSFEANNPQSERGLLAMAFHPEHAANGLFYVAYTDPQGDAVVARYRVRADDPNRGDTASEQVLMRVGQPGANHNVGHLAFGPDGYLYIATGDGGYVQEPRCAGQEGEHLRGKILRIDVDAQDPGLAYAIPADNPFAGPDGIRDEIWALGLRNPWRFSFDRLNGDLYIADVGQNTREEVNFLAAGSAGGQNYGFKMMEGSLCRGIASGCPSSVPACGSSAYTAPAFEYAHDGSHCAVIGGHVYRGSAIPELFGHYLYADYCGTLATASRTGNSWQQVAVDSPLAGGVLSFGEDAAGELYAISGDRLMTLVAATELEAGTVGLTDVTVSVGEADGFAQVGVSRVGGNVGQVTVNYSVVAGSAQAGEDYVVTSGTLVWPNFDIATRQILVPLIPDVAAEGTEDFTVRLAQTTGGAFLGRSTTTVFIEDDDDGSGGCTADATTLCLNDDRFQVTVGWRTPDGSANLGRAVDLTDDAGYFWFFGANNPELFVKLLDACSFADTFWVFAAGLTNVETHLTVVDTETGAVRQYDKSEGPAFAPIQDTGAFETCP